MAEPPPPAKPASHKLHPNLHVLAVHSTMIPASLYAVIQLFALLWWPAIYPWVDTLWATHDFGTGFVRDIKDVAGHQHPVLSVPDIRQSTVVWLYVYAARVTKEMQLLENLSSFCLYSYYSHRPGSATAAPIRWLYWRQARQ